MCEYEFLVDVDVFGFVGIVDVQCISWFDDQVDVVLWCQQLVQFILVVVGVGQIECDLYCIDVQCLYLGLQWLLMVDYMCGFYLLVLVD